LFAFKELPDLLHAGTGCGIVLNSSFKIMKAMPEESADKLPLLEIRKVKET